MTAWDIGLSQLRKLQVLNGDAVGSVYGLSGLGVSDVDELAIRGVADAVVDEVLAPRADGWDAKVLAKLFSSDQVHAALRGRDLGG